MTVKTARASVGALRYGGSLFDGTSSARSDRQIAFARDEEFVAYLRAAANERVARKADRALICASFVAGSRSTDNVIGSSGVWFDHDGKDGVTEPAHIPALLPGVRFVAVNTFSHTAALPRYRAWIPLTRMIAAEDYKVVWLALYQEITGKGAKGFDRAPSSAASLFYLPSVAASGEKLWLDGTGEVLNPNPIIDRVRRLQAVQDRLRQEQALRQPPETSVEEIKKALAAIPAEDRQVWLEVGCALKHSYAEAGFALWDEWSRKTTSNNYDARSQKRTWESIRPHKRPKTIASVFQLAKQYSSSNNGR
jgi:primase-like protein